MPLSRCLPWRERLPDNKCAFHVIASQNLLHGANCETPTKSSNKTIFIQGNNGEGPLSSYHWSLFNTLWDSAGVGIRADGDSAETLSTPITPPYSQASGMSGMKIYVIGNVIHDSNTTWSLGRTSPTGWSNYSWASESWWVNNVFIDSKTHHLDGNAGDQPFNNQVVGNIFYHTSRADLYTIGNNDNDNQDNSIDYNVFFYTGGAVTNDTHLFDSPVGNVSNVDPLLIAPGSRKPGILLNSPATSLIPSAAIPACYDLFESMYGINIKVDFYGKPRPVGNWSAGAFEPANSAVRGTGTVGAFTIRN